MRLANLLPLVLVACSLDLPLPPPPAAPATTITGLDTAEGWAGARVRIEGRFLGASPGVVQVRFGNSRGVAPLEVDAAGESYLVVSVPDDATSGPVTVQSPSGTATSGQAFTFRGLGRLRFGAVTRSTSFRSRIVGGFPDGEGGAFVVESRFEWAGTVGDTNGSPSTRVTGRAPLAMAPAANGTIAALVDADPEGCPGEAFGRLWIATGDSPSSAASVCVPRGGAALDDIPFATVAIDEEATHAVVSTNRTITLVDVAAEPPEIMATWPTNDDYPVQLAWAGGTAFLAGSGDRIDRIDWTEPGRGLHDPIDELVVNYIERIAVAPGRLLAVKDGDSRRVYLYDLATWPPVELPSVRLFTTEAEGLALSADGRRAAVSAWDGTLYVYDLSQEGYPVLAAHAQSWPGEVFSLPRDRLFAAGEEGGLVLVAEFSGALVRRIPVRTQARPPLFRRVPKGDAKEEVVDVPLATFDTILRLRVSDLTRRPLLARLSPPSITELVGTPEGPAYARHGSSIRRLEETDGVLTEPEAGRTTLDGGLSVLATTHLSDDGSVLVVRDWDGAQPAAVLLDTRGATWPAHPPRLRLSTRDNDENLTIVTKGTLVAWHDGRLEGLDLAAALAGTLTARWSRELPPARGRAIAHADGRVYVTSEEPGVETNVDVVDPVTGAAVRGRVPGWERLATREVFAPAGGRRLMAVRGLGQLARVASVALVPETAEAGAEDVPVALPAGTGGLTLSDDGTRLFVVDRERDELLVVE